jgi:hypothetical protein
MKQGSFGRRLGGIVSTSALLVTAACLLTACSRNVEPGDSNYPIANPHPTQTVDLSIVDLELPRFGGQFIVFVS